MGILQWEGNCCFNCFATVIDDGDGLFDVDKDEICGPLCPDTSMVRVDDPNLCMQGMKLRHPCISKGQHNYFALYVMGEVESMKMMPYGIYSGDQYKEYDLVQSPVCGMTLPCLTNDPTCKTYPMQISELSLAGKCNEFEHNPISRRNRKLSENEGEYMC